VMDMDKDVCRTARIVLGGVAPIPWRLPAVEAMLAGHRVTPELAAKAGEAAVAGARPLAKNGYKVPMVRTMVSRTIADIADRGLRTAN
jgi:xanthine dehydrogenase YagS FAD-binding subunit